MNERPRNAHVAEPFRTIVNAAGVPLSAQGSRMLLQTLLDAKPTRVCLRHRPEITGTVLVGDLEPGRVRVLWDDTEQVTHCPIACLRLNQEAE